MSSQRRGRGNRRSLSMCRCAFLLALALALLAGCVGDVEQGALPNKAPTISGTPPTTAAVGAPYSFAPTASDPDGDALTFSIANPPAWASFDAGTGALTGTPGGADVGEFSGIAICASDGYVAAPVCLGAFGIAVGGGTTGTSPAPMPPTGVSASPGDGQVTVSWNAVSGATSYNLYWSLSSGVTKATGAKLANVASPYVHAGLTNGTAYYYVITSVNAVGESPESTEVTETPQLTAGGISLWDTMVWDRDRWQ